ncbi:MAG: hypothetical protein EP343_06505 [Deltaproteobacteria bacterium]|nr:MAG: hypothetical protein EP343_06505 [Deltaproteobacteria bacterium]
MRPFITILSSFLAVFVLISCGSPSTLSQNEAPFLLYEQDAVIVSNKGEILLHSTRTQRCNPNRYPCIKVTRGGRYCEGASDGPVDILTHPEILTTRICYPGYSERGPRRVTLNWNASVQNDKQVVLFDYSTRDRRFNEPLQVQANRVSVYGKGPTLTTFVGNSEVAGNKVRLRGLTVRGDLKIHGNQNVLLFARVFGDLTIEGNNAVIGHVIVHGNLIVKGNNNVLFHTDVEGKKELWGNGYRCALTFHFEDQNGNFVLEPQEERTTPWSCP